MTNKPWKAAYWPQIVEEVEKKRIEDEKNNYYSLYIYDYTGSIYRLLDRKKDDRPDSDKHNSRNYFYVTTKETMESICNIWFELNPRLQSDMRRRMKGFEETHLHKVLYEQRKEEFDALVAETNS
jgi:hypothetical protein